MRHQPKEDAVKAQTQIRQWCKDGGRKLGWLAQQVPVEQETLSRWLNSKAMPSTVYRIRLSHITGIDDLRDSDNWITKEALA
jgi:hypothetical protein